MLTLAGLHLAHRGREAIHGSPDVRWEGLRGKDESGGVGSEVGEEEREPIEDEHQHGDALAKEAMSGEPYIFLGWRFD